MNPSHSDVLSTSPPEPGEIVHVRSRPYVVRDVKASQLPPEKTAQAIRGQQHLVKLASVEDEGLGEELEVIWEIEPGAHAQKSAGLPDPAGFDDPRRYEAFLHAVAWGAVSSADDKALQSPFRSGVTPEDYQLDPVVRALSMPRVNLLIADDVGLGKTIETGLVAQELILRHRVRTILVVCPSSLQIQWQEEMREKFGLDFRIVDTELLRDLRRKRGIHANPWSHFPRLITSIDFLKRERPMRLLRELLPAGEVAYPRPFDLLIVDEAHNVAPSGRNRYAIDSHRTEAIRTLVPYFEHRLFLSATPHNGFPESFTALLELLDNQRFLRGAEINRAQLETVMVRRLKSELETNWDGSRRFAKREVLHIDVAYTPAEKAAHAQLQEYARLLQGTAGTPGERAAVDFVLKLLKKRLFSSPAAFLTTIEKHAASIGSARRAADSSVRRQIQATEDEYANDEEAEQLLLDAVEVASQAAVPTGAEPKRLLAGLQTFAREASRCADSKAEALLDWLRTHIKPGGTWSNERVIIFTEYRATLNWLLDQLAANGFGGIEKRVMMIYGGMDPKDREAVKNAFQANPADSPVRILLATDAASEGLNLQNHCWRLFHFEIPWNPNRMEQRNGRVDRHGQKAPEVHIHHFVAKGFELARTSVPPGELEGDLEFLYRAAVKVNTIREDLGRVGPVIAQQVEEAMLGQRKRLDTQSAEKEADSVRKVLQIERKLREQVKKLTDQLRDTRQSLDLTPENIQLVVATGLELAGQPALIPAKVRGLDIPAFHLPALSGAWADCATGLAHPHTRKVRPIVFDGAPIKGRDDVVLCHLNHRLVQMCMRLLRAEIWSTASTRKLNRFTTRIVPDHLLAHPVVIAHGRLLVIGGDHQRIHEEIITAGGEIKAGRFSRITSVGDLDKLLAEATDQAAPGTAEDALVKLWPKLKPDLLKALDARMKQRTENLHTILEARSQREVAKLAENLAELTRDIQKVLADEDDPQLMLDLSGASDEEQRQRDNDLDNLRHRLQEIPAELERETAHLRARYRNPEPRLFPVGVTFLIPKSALSVLHGESR